MTEKFLFKVKILVKISEKISNTYNQDSLILTFFISRTIRLFSTNLSLVPLI
jgi:hypothetical protein